MATGKAELQFVEYKNIKVLERREKAYLLLVNDIRRWAPRAGVQLSKDETSALITDWLDKKWNQGGALFSDDRTKRYVLWRNWHDNKLWPEKWALCIGLNPSTAREDKDDQTINRLTSILTEQGYTGFRMVNLFTMVTSKPEELDTSTDETADLGIVYANALLCQDVIFCWGTFPQAKERGQKIINVFPDAFCFGKTLKGDPWHPMALHYAGLKADTTRMFKYKDHKPEDNVFGSKTARKRARNANQDQIDVFVNDDPMSNQIKLL